MTNTPQESGAMTPVELDELAAMIAALSPEQVAQMTVIVNRMQKLDTPPAKTDAPYYEYTRREAKTTHPDAGSLMSEEIRHFRLAWAILGSLVVNGDVRVDWRVQDWHERLRLTVGTIAATLDEFEG